MANDGNKGSNRRSRAQQGKARPSVKDQVRRGQATAVRTNGREGGLRTDRAAATLRPDAQGTAAGQPVMPAEDAPSQRVTLPSRDGGVSVSRRGFIAGAVGIGAVAAAAGGLYIYSNQGTPETPIETIEVPEDAVFTIDDCNELPVETTFARVAEYELPFGTLVWANNPYVAACLLPTDNASPLTQVALLGFEDGALTSVLEGAVGRDDGYEIYDVRASRRGLVWLEANILEGLWRLYAAPFSTSMGLGTARIVERGDANIDAPSLAAVGEYLFWQTMPSLSSEERRSGQALLKRTRFTGGDAEVVYEATGRMAAPLYACEDAVVITPANADSQSYYDLVHIDAETAKVTDRLTLPRGMRPNQVGYGPNGFSFCFENIYNYGDGIANLGTYTPASPTAQRSSYSSDTWFRFGRTPQSGPCWCTDNWLMVKSTTSVCAVNLAQREFCLLGSMSGSTDWGDYLVTSGVADQVATVSQIDSTDSSGNLLRSTRVRVWRPMTAEESAQAQAEIDAANAEDENADDNPDAGAVDAAGQDAANANAGGLGGDGDSNGGLGGDSAGDLGGDSLTYGPDDGTGYGSTYPYVI